MKIKFFVFVFLIGLVSAQVVHAKDYSSNRCQIMEGNDGVMEKVFGKFEELQTKCCRHALKSACEEKAAWDSCNKTLYSTKTHGIGDDTYSQDCPDDCQLWVKDCQEYVSKTETAKILREQED